MTGWELGVQFQSYSNSGWLVGSIFDLTGPNIWANPRHTDTFQPASGYGGGRYCLAIGSGANNDDRSLATPATGPTSIGTHQDFIFHTAYKRQGSTGNIGWLGGMIYGFYSGTQEIYRLSHTASQLPISAMSFYAWNGATMVFQGTSTTTYTDSQPYHRIVFDIEGSTGTYDIYIDGVLEISNVDVTTLGNFVDVLKFRSGCVNSIASGGTGVNGGRHDQCVLFDAGNHAEGDCVIGNLPADTEQVVVGGKTYTFQAALTDVDGNVFRGTTAAEARRNLIHAMNLGPNPSSAYYAPSMTLNSVVTAEEDLSATAVHVEAKVKGVDVSATTDTLTGGGDGWVLGTLTGGDLDKSNDLALALGDIFIQGLLPNADVVDGSFLNVNGVNDGTNTDMYANINDGDNLTDFIETTTSPDAAEFDHEARSDINPLWAPSVVHAVQTVQVARASGAISAGRTTIDIPSLGKTTSDSENLSVAGTLVPSLRKWRTGNPTTDLDGIKTGIEV
jgi:hypothetical protein